MLSRAFFVGFGFDQFVAWRLAMIVPGAIMLVTGFAYYFLTHDTPDGKPVVGIKSASGAFREAAADPRVWLLFVLYGACFGIEITVDNAAALYFKDHFKLSLGLAGFLAGLTGMMNIFARALGGYLGDRWGRRGFICVSTHLRYCLVCHRVHRTCWRTGTCRSSSRSSSSTCATQGS